MSGCPKAPVRHPPPVPAGVGPGAWDVAASLGYVACDEPGLAWLAELCCGLDCCGLGSCQYFQEKGEGREAEAAFPSYGCSPCLPGGCQGQLSSSQGMWFAPLELPRPLSGLNAVRGFGGRDRNPPVGIEGSPGALREPLSPSPCSRGPPCWWEGSWGFPVPGQRRWLGADPSASPGCLRTGGSHGAWRNRPRRSWTASMRWCRLSGCATSTRRSWR